jgi:hypothetical protein
LNTLFLWGHKPFFYDDTNTLFIRGKKHLAPFFYDETNTLFYAEINKPFCFSGRHTAKESTLNKFTLMKGGVGGLADFYSTLFHYCFTLIKTKKANPLFINELAFM